MLHEIHNVSWSVRYVNEMGPMVGLYKSTRELENGVMYVPNCTFGPALTMSTFLYTLIKHS